MTERMLFSAAASFESARKVGVLPSEHRSSRLHGHSFLARVRTQLPADWADFPGGEVEQLAERLQQSVASLDYDFLNDHLDVPTDENLARWVSDRLQAPALEMIGIQSTRHEGADLDLHGNAHIWRRYRFESAHQLPNVPPGHQCGRMHGHGFEVILHANQNIGDQDMGVDYDHLDACWAPISEELDHACLNDIPGLENPTSEMIAAWIWGRLKDQLPQLSWVTVYETVTAGCHFDGAHYRIWKEQRFESAMRLTRAADGDRRRRLHGHSYLLRLHLTAPLDPVMGWTVDYGDVKDCFKPVYKRLDHHLLNELEGLGDSDPASLTRWIRKTIGNQLPELDRIDLYQTPGCGAIYSWGERGPALPT
jgi:6-pyruvoyltetrahydropterin/6-carboxytetrahydropterin synthase